MKTTLRNRFVPSYDALEERSLMAVTASFNPALGLLTITGTPQADKIKIVDTGSQFGAGAVQVFSNNQLIFSSPTPGNGVSAVKSITMDTGIGKDQVDYLLTGNLTANERTVTARLQGDADRFTAVINGSLVLGSSLKIDVNGGEGNDNISATMNGNVGGSLGIPPILLPASSMEIKMDGRKDDDTLTTVMNGDIGKDAKMVIDMAGSTGNDKMNTFALAGVDIGVGGTLDIAMRGQEGDDKVYAFYFGQNKGTLKTITDGGPGADKVETHVTLAAGSTGVVNSGMGGGPQNDKLKMLIRKLNAADPATITANVNGGPDFDTLTKTANVTHSAVEVVTVVP